MSANRTMAASPVASSAWCRSITVAIERGQRPPTSEHATHERVVDAELTALGPETVLGRLGVAVDLVGVTRVGVDQHQLADVV